MIQEALRVTSACTIYHSASLQTLICIETAILRGYFFLFLFSPLTSSQLMGCCLKGFKINYLCCYSAYSNLFRSLNVTVFISVFVENLLERWLYYSLNITRWPEWLTFYIYIYAFSRRFYTKWLTVHSRFNYFFPVCVFSGNWTHNLFALLTQCSTTEPQEHRTCIEMMNK